MFFKTLPLLLLLIAGPAAGEPQIKQFFPERPLLLGQPVFWIVEVRYPLWESYSIKPNKCEGADLQVTSTEILQMGGEMVARVRISVRPTALNITDTPSLLVIDEDGQSATVTGKPITVAPISGDSMQLREPSLSFTATTHSRNKSSFYLFSALLIILTGLLFWNRRRIRNPRYLLNRDLKRTLVEIRRGRLPQQTWRLLRSDLLWGFPAEVYTPLQLQERVSPQSALAQIAGTLRTLEEWRYTGNQSAWDRSRLERAVVNAMEIASRRKSSRK